MGGHDRGSGPAAGCIWGGEPFYGARMVPGWYQTGTSVPRGRNLPFSLLRLLMQCDRKPPQGNPLAVSRSSYALQRHIACREQGCPAAGIHCSQFQFAVFDLDDLPAKRFTRAGGLTHPVALQLLQARFTRRRCGPEQIGRRDATGRGDLPALGQGLVLHCGGGALGRLLSFLFAEEYEGAH